MKTKFDGNLLFVVMEKGELVAVDMRALAALHSMKPTGTVITAAGMVKNAIVGYGSYHNPEIQYERKVFAEPLELLGLSGFILKSEAIPFHLHVTLGNDRWEAVGGHLFDAEVVTFVEMCILLSDTPVRRILKDGLPEMDFPE